MAEFMISRLLKQLLTITQLKGVGKGVEEDVEKLSFKLAEVQAVLFVADQLQFSDESVRRWIDKVEDFCYEADTMLDEWRSTAIFKSTIGEEESEIGLSMAKVCFCMPSSYFSPILDMSRDIARKLIELNKNVDEIITDQKKYAFERRSIEEERRMTTVSTSFLHGIEVYGRDKEKSILMNKLLRDMMTDFDIIPIVGMGGIGKTTLAQVAYNDSWVRTHFDLRIWVHVGDPFDLIGIAKNIIYAINGSLPNLLELESLLDSVNKSVQGKRLLLVLDDVWTEDWTKWEPLEGSLKHGAYEIRVLVTTRNKKVAAMMKATTHMISLETLSEEACRYIFNKLAFPEGVGAERQQLEEIGKEIVKKCKGVPLIAKTLGHLMHFKDSKQEWIDVSRHHLWEFSDVRRTVFAPLWLSYYDLSPLEKCCLLYCSLFPTDFEIDKDDLIELWMSEGYLDGNKSLERGENCFNSLVMRSIFQNVKKNIHGKITKCRMNYAIHECVQFVTRDRSFLWEGLHNDKRTNLENETIRHCTLLLRSAQIPISVYKKKKLRTLFVMGLEVSTPLNLDLLSKLTRLRTLCLRGCSLEKLPYEIHKLRHLQYLNLSYNSKLMELPYQLCNLLNLETLRLNDCTKLQRLPKQMEKLVNLQHLYIDGCKLLKELPKGIGRLPSLRILDVFILPFDYLQNKKAMKLGDLNKLEHLQGNLSIRGLGDKEHAVDSSKAQLSKMKHLAGLELTFSQVTEPWRKESEMKILLEDLQPPPDLNSVEIREYSGATFPNWIVSLVNLRSLVLNRCPNCEYLPPFGKLPSLEILHIRVMDMIKIVDREFLGVESSKKSFPKLKELCFQGLNRWEEWSGPMYLENSMTIMPSLRSLIISNCNRLRTLPDFIQKIQVQDLTIDNCPMLESRYKEGVGVDSFKISHIPNIRINESTSTIQISETPQEIFH